VPVRSRAQMLLLENGLKDEHYLETQNVKAIQKRIRKIMKGFSTTLMEPYADWQFLEGSKALESLGKSELTGERIDNLVEQINGNLNPEHIQKAILEAERRETLLENWEEKVEKDKWSAFPPKIQVLIREIEKDERQYKWEQQFLDLLINPGKWNYHHLREALHFFAGKTPLL
jgi:hypothetical protein